MAEYLVLIYEDEAAWEDPGAGTAEEMMKGHRLFGERNGAAIRGGNALLATSTATSLRRDATGDFVVTDGPFAETKEQLGGYFLVGAGSQDEALAIAAKIPSARFGGVEVRPIWVMA